MFQACAEAEAHACDSMPHMLKHDWSKCNHIQWLERCVALGEHTTILLFYSDQLHYLKVEMRHQIIPKNNWLPFGVSFFVLMARNTFQTLNERFQSQTNQILQWDTPNHKFHHMHIHCKGFQPYRLPLVATLLTQLEQ